jgi:hypothetical protein
MNQPEKVVIPTFNNQPDSRMIASQIAVVSIVILAILAIVGYMVLNAPVASEQRMVTYRIEGTCGNARMTYTETDGHQTDALSIAVPWQSPPKLFRSTTKVFLTAGNPQSSGTITCIMLLDGVEWKRDSSTQPEGKVACGGIVP